MDQPAADPQAYRESLAGLQLSAGDRRRSRLLSYLIFAPPGGRRRSRRAAVAGYGAATGSAGHKLWVSLRFDSPAQKRQRRQKGIRAHHSVYYALVHDDSVGIGG